jgi:hypothetical protein
MDFLIPHDETKEKRPTFENTIYNYDRRKRQTLLLDIDEQLNSTSSGTDFTLLLDEPLTIDKSSDIFLDTVITFDLNHKNTNTDGKNICFLIGIDQFNINSIGGSAATGTDPQSAFNGHLRNKILIPNEEGATGGNKAATHKGKKMNYICQIDPCRLTKITGSVTDLDGAPTFNSTDKGRMLIEFVIVSRD